MNLESLESHGRVEYWIGEYLKNYKIENKKKKTKKNEDEHFQLFIYNSYDLQNLITKISICSHHEVIVFG